MKVSNFLYLKPAVAPATWYNYTSDAGHGMFTCTRGEIDGDIVRLYEEFDYGTDVLILKKVENGYHIVSHQQLNRN